MARLNPGAVAVVRADHSSVRYGAFDKMIDAMAAHLSTLGLRAGQTVGLAIAGADEFAGLLVGLALARLGVASADPGLPAERMDLCIIEDGRSTKPACGAFRSGRCWRTCNGRIRSRSVSIHPDGPALFRIFGSSGTTGVPTFSAVSHDVMAARVSDSWLALGRVPAVQICAIGMGITWGWTRMLRTFWTGGTLVLTDPAEAMAAIRRHKVTALSIAPVSLQQALPLCRQTRTHAGLARLVEVSGSLLPSRLAAVAGKGFARHCSPISARPRPVASRRGHCLPSPTPGASVIFTRVCTSRRSTTRRSVAARRGGGLADPRPQRHRRLCRRRTCRPRLQGRLVLRRRHRFCIT